MCVCVCVCVCACVRACASRYIYIYMKSSFSISWIPFVAQLLCHLHLIFWLLFLKLNAGSSARSLLCTLRPMLRAKTLRRRSCSRLQRSTRARAYVFFLVVLSRSSCQSLCSQHWHDYPVPPLHFQTIAHADTISLFACTTHPAQQLFQYKMLIYPVNVNDNHWVCCALDIENGTFLSVLLCFCSLYVCLAFVVGLSFSLMTTTGSSIRSRRMLTLLLVLARISCQY